MAARYWGVTSVGVLNGRVVGEAVRVVRVKGGRKEAGKEEFVAEEG